VEQYSDVQFLKSMLLNKDQDNKVLDHNLFVRYRALFTLRELNTKASILAICSSLLIENMDTCGALLKHEVAYVLAQMEDHNEHSVPFLLDSVLNDDEDPIVRHEALIAVGEMIDEKERLEHLL
jgi:deoxyhypusine monooxygenase